MKPPKLPAAYQEVEYIGSTTGGSSAAEYIEIGIYPQLSDALTIKFQATGDYSGDAIRPLGAYTPGVEIDGYRGLRLWTNSAIDFGGGNINIADGNIHTMSCSDVGAWEYDGTAILTGNPIQTQQSISIVLFKARYLNRVLYGNGTLRIYEFKYYRNGAAICSLVPCYRKSDNVIGMYDLVTNTFFTNAGTGTFEKGNNV